MIFFIKQGKRVSKQSAGAVVSAGGGDTGHGVRSDKMPSGIPYIVGNEAAERFSYYGMRTILTVFMTQYLMNSSGQLDVMSDGDAKFWFHIFMLVNYLMPIVGAVVADIFWGKYKTIMRLSIVYCLGHLALALFETRFGLAAGLTLIAIGSGGIKPCVSAHVGDQFSKKNNHLLGKVFSFFYFSINLGGAFSSLLTPLLLVWYGPSVAFGVPGALMFLATFVFWLGRDKFVAIPEAGWQQYKQDVFNKETLRSLGSFLLLYLCTAVFWSLYDQGGSAWVLQAEKMSRYIDLGFTQFTLLPSQIQAVNPFLILIFIPLFAYVIYPLAERYLKVTPLRKIGVGLFICALSFVITAIAEMRIASGVEVSILWQVWAYVAITAAEILVSITALEYSYTQAPNTSKSLIMGLWFLSVSFGNAITAVVNWVIQNPDGTSKLTDAQYYWFFAGLMFVTAIGFVFVAMRKQERTYIQTRPAELDLNLAENN